MIQGTSLMITFRLYGTGVPNLEKAQKVRVVLSQEGNVYRWETPSARLKINGTTVSLRMNREDTAAFHPGQIMTQVRWMAEDGTVGESLVRTLRVYRAFDREPM